MSEVKMRWIGFLILALAASKGRASTAEDILLSGYYLGKGAGPFLVLQGMDRPNWAYLSLPVMTLPASMVLYHRAVGEAVPLRRWRKIAFGIDVGVAGVGFVTGSLFSLAYGDHGENKTLGEVIMIASVGYGLVSLLDLLAFSIEQPENPRLVVVPLLDFSQRQTGLMLCRSF